MLGPAGAVLVVLGVVVVGWLVVQLAGDRANGLPVTVPGHLPYLGGSEPEVHAWNRFHVRYYPMAYLFLAFDMEMVFMYPWAVVFVREGVVALAEMGMFIVILLLGVLYAWRERALEWA